MSMVKLKKGKKSTKYSISLIHRGHKKIKDSDLIVQFKGRIVERLGYSRWYLDSYVYFLHKAKFMKWAISSNIVISTGAKKWLLKYVILGFYD